MPRTRQLPAVHAPLSGDVIILQGGAAARYARIVQQEEIEKTRLAAQQQEAEEAARLAKKYWRRIKCWACLACTCGPSLPAVIYVLVHFSLLRSVTHDFSNIKTVWDELGFFGMLFAAYGALFLVPYALLLVALVAAGIVAAIGYLLYLCGIKTGSAVRRKIDERRDNRERVRASAPFEETDRIEV